MPFSFFRVPELPDLVVIRPDAFSDERGIFLESYQESAFRAAGIEWRFVQDNHSVSGAGVLRGLHYQLPPHAQGKLVRVVRGRVWDVAVDIRRSSPSFGRWYGMELSAENRTMLFVPPGFAHGFLALEDGTEFLYKCTAEYRKESDRGIRWNDPELQVMWPVPSPMVSEKDAALPLFGEAELFG